MRRGIQVTLVALASLIGASEAAAVTTKNFFNYCTTGSVKTCASVQVQTTAAGGMTSVVMRVRNLQGTNPVDNTLGSVLTQVGLTAPTGIGSLSDFAVSVDGSVQQHNNPGGHWSAPAGPIGGQVVFSAGTSPGHQGGIIGCDDAGNGQSFFRTCDGTGHTGWVVFSFTTGSVWSANDAQIAFKVQSTNFDGGSYECRSEATIGQPHHCEPGGPPPDQVIPEPMTLALLGTGLVGLGAFRAMRRRRDDVVAADDAEDDR